MQATHHQIILEVEEYARAADMTPEAVCRAATNNARLFRRLRDKSDQFDDVVARLRRFMGDNPVRSKITSGTENSAGRHEKQPVQKDKVRGKANA